MCCKRYFFKIAFLFSEVIVLRLRLGNSTSFDVSIYLIWNLDGVWRNETYFMLRNIIVTL